VSAKRTPTAARREELKDEVLNEIWRMLSIEDPWAVRAPGSITWWAHRVAQHVRITDGGRPGGQHKRLRVSIEMDCLRGVAFDEAALSRLDRVNRLTTLAGLATESDTGRIFVASTAYVGEANVSWKKMLLGLTAGLSAALGHALSLSAADWGPGALVDESAHPVSGPRPDVDDILAVPAKVFCYYGAGESLFIGKDMEALQAIRPRPWVLASGGSDEFTAGFPFWGYLPAMMSGKTLDTALLQVTTEERNPTYGSGALLRLTLPLQLDEKMGLDVAAHLNRRESTEWTGFDHLGAWCANPPLRSVTYVCFLPSKLKQQLPPALLQMVWNMAARARWAAAVFGKADA